MSLCITILLLAIYMSSGNLSKESYTKGISYGEPLAVSDSTLKVMTYNIGYLSGMTNNRSIARERERFEAHLAQAKILIQEMLLIFKCSIFIY